MAGKNRSLPVEKLQELGFTHDEAYIYLFLLENKGSRIQDLLKDRYLGKKKRPNLYKVLGSLKAKKYIYDEPKQQGSVFFAEKPSFLALHLVQQKEQDLENFKLLVGALSSELDPLYRKEKYSPANLPPILEKYIKKGVPDSWVIRESIHVQPLPSLGTIYSVEFNTRHKFKGDAAGLIIHEFRYPEHIPQVFNNICEYHKNQLRESLENLRNKGFVGIREFVFEDTGYTPKKSSKTYRITENHVTLSIGVKGKGALMTARVDAFPRETIGIWASNMTDFGLMVSNLEKLSELSQPFS